MSQEFVMTAAFDRLWKGLGLTDDDLRLLQTMLIDNPNAGDVIRGANGARKVRFVMSNVGKSGGARIIYVNVVRLQQLYLLLCYSKAQKDDITAEQKKHIKALVQTLKEV